MSSDSPHASEIQDLSQYYHQYKVAVYDNLFTGFVYGAYIVVYLTSVYILLSKPGFTSSPPRMFMFGITMFMFTLGTIALALVTTVRFRIIHTIFSGGGLPPSIDRCYYAWAAITCLMYILCDIICAWRTVVIWNRDKRIIAVLVLFILVTMTTAGCALVTGVVNNLTPDDANLLRGTIDLVMIGPTVATNLY